MADEDTMHRCVTKFMHQTCRRTTTSLNTMIACYSRCLSRTILSPIFGDCQLFSSGSSAELYITPMLSCIDDIDTMYCLSSCIAIPAEHEPPAELPHHYQHVVTAYEIVDSHQPGYVYLQKSYTLTKIDNIGSYVVEKNWNTEAGVEFTANINCMSEMIPDLGNIVIGFFQESSQNGPLHDLSLSFLNHPGLVAHGPAITSDNQTRSRDTFGFKLSGVDSVICVKCRRWPPQAAEWLTRPRQHGWPESSTVRKVEQDGCDVVQAVHPSCRQDEWMSKHQWRLSFSRAEVTLLNSWTPVRQIVYHMLRFVMKRTVLAITNDSNPNWPKLCNYHIKTLMLWECEEKPQSWWSAESSLIKLCSSLLHKLSDCVAVKHCQQYFISNCNLLDHFVHDDDASLTTCNRLKGLADERVLLSWFVDNYIRQSALNIPANVSVFLLLEDVSSNDKLDRAVQAVIDSKLCQIPLECTQEHHVYETAVLMNMQMYSLDAEWAPGVIRVVMEELESFDHRIRDYFVAAATLHVAHKAAVRSVTENVLDVLWSIFFPRTSAVGGNHESGGVRCIGKAVKLFRVSTACSNASEMLHDEMAKAYLHHSLAYGQEFTYCVVHILLAALYYKAGHYQSAIDHCKQVLNQTACEQYCSRSIGAEYLPQMDETVDAVLGLILFYQHVQRSEMKCDKEAQPMFQPAFTLDLLAHYLHSQSSGVRSSELSMYRRHLIETNRPLVGDVLLFTAVQTQLKECTGIADAEIRTEDIETNASSSTMDTGLLVTTLELVALEKLTSVRQMMVRELHSQQFPVLNEFGALYAYKCGLFEECLVMCRNHVKMLLRTHRLVNQLYSVSYTEMLSLLDGELVSFYGVVRLLYPVLWLLRTNLPDYCEISMATVSLYLMAQCQKKLRGDSFQETLRLILLFHNIMVRTDDDVQFIDRLTLRITYRSLKLFAESKLADNGDEQ